VAGSAADYRTPVNPGRGRADGGGVKRALLVLVSILAVLALSGCGRSDQGASLPDRPEGTSGRSATTGEVEHATGSQGEGQSEDEAEDGDQGGSEAAASNDDLKVFAFATTDEAALATELIAIAVTVAALESDLVAHDLDAAKADAHALLDQAEALGADAANAEGRQQPLEPEDRELVAARKDAIDAFGLTAEYASSVTDIANAVLGGQLGQLPALAQDAADLAGSGEELTRSCTDLNTELLAWAEANPGDAARALAKYGEDA